MIFEDHLYCPWCLHQWEAEPPTGSAHYDYETDCPKCRRHVAVTVEHRYCTSKPRTIIPLSFPFPPKGWAERGENP